MKLAFWKKSKEEKPVVRADDTVADGEAKEDVAPPPPTAAENIEILRELLKQLTAEQAPNSQDVKFLRSAFSKATSTVLADPALVTEETFKAFADYAVTVKDKELRQEAFSALGRLTSRNASYSDIGIPLLTTAIDDTSAEVRSSALNALVDTGKTNAGHAAKIVDILVNVATSAKLEVREGAIGGLTTLALKYEVHADKALEVLTAALAKNPSKDVSQSYTGRNRAAHCLGQIGLAFPAKIDAAIKGLTPGLKDADIFVQYRTIASFVELGRKDETKIDGIVEKLKAAKEDAIYIVNAKLDSAISTLRPPAKPVKTPEEIETEHAHEEAKLKAQAEAQAKADEAVRQKAEAEAQKKQRHDGIRLLANKLPGIQLK